MLSSSLYTMLKPSKTTSPKKLFDYDFVTLYIQCDEIKWEQVLQRCRLEKPLGIRTTFYTKYIKANIFYYGDLNF